MYIGISRDFLIFIKFFQRSREPVFALALELCTSEYQEKKLIILWDGIVVPLENDAVIAGLTRNLPVFALIPGIAGQARNDEWDIFQG